VVALGSAAVAWVRALIARRQGIDPENAPALTHTA